MAKAQLIREAVAEEDEGIFISDDKMSGRMGSWDSKDEPKPPKLEVFPNHAQPVKVRNLESARDDIAWIRKAAAECFRGKGCARHQGMIRLTSGHPSVWHRQMNSRISLTRFARLRSR